MQFELTIRPKKVRFSLRKVLEPSGRCTMKSDHYESWRNSVVSQFSELTDDQQISLISDLIDKAQIALKYYLSQSLQTLLKRDFISLLPVEVSHQILDYLDSTSLLKCSCVSAQWKDIIMNYGAVWKKWCVRTGALVTSGMSSLNCMKSFVFTEQLLTSLKKHTAWNFIKQKTYTEKIVAITYSAGLVACGLGNNVIEIWDENEHHSSPKLTLKVSNQISSISLNTSTIAVGHFMGNCTVWDLDTHQKKCNLIGHIGAVLCVTFDTCSELLVTGSSDNTAKLWDMKTQDLLYNIKLEEENVWISSVYLNKNENGKIQISLRGKKIIKYCVVNDMDFDNVEISLSTSNCLSDICKNPLIKKVIKGYKLDNYKLIYDRSKYKELHNAIEYEQDAFIVACGTCFTVLIIGTRSPVLCIINTRNHDVLATYPLVSTHFTPRLETLISLGGSDWLDGISDSNTTAVLLAYRSNDQSLNYLTWSKQH